MVSATTLVGALATIPAGILADRRPRRPLLAACTALWSLTMLAGALAPNYSSLLATRMGLGLVTAAAGPIVASLTGDLFPEQVRGEVFGRVLAGELVGAGLGFALVGNAAVLVGWRGALALLGAGAAVLPILILRGLPEPTRHASGAGDEAIGFGAAARIVLRIPTNVVLIIVSALLYFYLTGIQTFGAEYTRGRFGVGAAEANLLLLAVGSGALVGVVAGGRIADRLQARGRHTARVVVPGVAALAAAVVFVPGLLAGTLLAAVPILAVALGLVTATNPPLDAARLDVVPGALWGRAESIRVVARTLFVASAPLCFGLLSGAFGAGEVDATVSEGAAVDPAVGSGLAATFLLMLIPLVGSGLLLLLARRTYVRDVRTQGGHRAMDERTRPGERPPPLHTGVRAGVNERGT